MENIINGCIARQLPDNIYSINNITNIGEVVMRNDGYYGVAVCQIDTSEDAKLYCKTHISYMTYAPLILYLIQADVSQLNDVTLTTSLFNEIHTLFGFDSNVWHTNNVQYLTKMELIWIHQINDCANQSTENIANNVVFRKTYDYFINIGIQNSDPDFSCC